jgi:uncharacterized membrane protein YbhN (UPF0104 family)
MAGSGRLMKALRPFHAILASSAWNWIGFALSATIVAISVYVLTRLLRDIDIARVAADLYAMPTANITAAIFFVACAYGTLTWYDLFALRTIEANHVRYRIAALASFTSYAIGHNIGATAFSGGAIRYRIYSQFGLGVIDVAKICFLTGLTFWLGNLAVLGSGMIYLPDVPSHILKLPPPMIQKIGAAALILLAGYVGWAWRRPRSFGRKGWRVTLPSGLSTLVQIGIGIADLGCSSLAMYNLLPGAAGEGFFTIAVAFVSATLLGFASHAPGSLGVFDVAMLVALPHVGREELVAGLLAFRTLYFILPFALALATMACWEAMLFLRRQKEDDGGRMSKSRGQMSDQPCEPADKL